MKKTMSSKLAGFLIVSMVSMTAGVIPAFAAVTSSSGPNNPGTVVSSTIGVSGDVAWSNVNNAKTSNDSHATADLGATPSEYLKATGFGFAIPAGAVINGVQASIERKQTCFLVCPVTDNIVKLVKAGTVTGNNKANTSTAWPTTDASATYGSASDMWGTTWTVSDINNANFGLAVSA